MSSPDTGRMTSRPEHPEGKGAERVKHAYPIVLRQNPENGMYGASAPDVPGCVTARDTREETLKNVEEAIALYVETLLEAAEPVPAPSDKVDDESGSVERVQLDESRLNARCQQQLDSRGSTVAS